MPGTLIISLDFELHWGMRDLVSIDHPYVKNILGAREAIPRILELFKKYDTHATWATVGFLFASNKEELLDSLPAIRPSYVDSRFSPYADLSLVGADESSDPIHFAHSLINLISSYPNQEIGTHTFSHYYAAEEGQTAEQFEADLAAAQRAGNRRQMVLRSLVFPRNQVNPLYIGALTRAGITAYRGNPSSWLYRASTAEKDESSKLKRLLRLADAYVPLSGPNTFTVGGSQPKNIPASAFLRPYSKTLSFLDPIRLRRIKNALAHAAKTNSMWHLWWHPHNFGQNQKESLLFLEEILKCQKALGIQSRNMGELA